MEDLSDDRQPGAALAREVGRRLREAARGPYVWLCHFDENWRVVETKCLWPTKGPTDFYLYFPVPKKLEGGAPRSGSPE